MEYGEGVNGVGQPPISILKMNKVGEKFKYCVPILNGVKWFNHLEILVFKIKTSLSKCYLWISLNFSLIL